MATKWKNKTSFIILLILFTYGLHSIFLFLNDARTYIGKDYFTSNDFQFELHQYIDFLALFELNDITQEEAINQITVTQNEIEEHRYRFGNLSEQLQSINNQYESLIEEAKTAGQQTLIETYTKERDAKIEDISQNFASDDYVREKIIKEKEALISKFFEEKERLYKEYFFYHDAFLYYFINKETNTVYTNIPNANDKNEKERINRSEMAFIKNFGMEQIPALDISNRNYSRFIENIETVTKSPIGEVTITSGELPIEVQPSGTFKGTIAISKDTIQSHSFWSSYHEFIKQKQIFYIVTITGVILFIVSILLFRKIQIDDILQLNTWKQLYNQIPIDIRIAIFIVSMIVTLLLLSASHQLYYYDSFTSTIDDGIIFLFSLSLLILLIYVQGKLLLTLTKDNEQFKVAWKKSAVLIAYRLLQDAFLKAPNGIKTMILLMIVFLFGAGFTLSLMKIELVIVYIIASFFIGLPILLYILRQIGQLNKLADHIEQLANGNVHSQLSIKGKSPFAELAKNINTLKEAMTASQKVQAKSERLKTELITNVSHDLRTPLTSIITYTELLKNEDISQDERNCYIDIIDRKSKRLKVLIDDLFEASKMASGNIELIKEKIDLVSLLQQALAEHDELIQQSSLDFRISHPTPPLYAVVDGQKLWRVFDNLVSNILKYSLENTRVYISIALKDNCVVITFKNITKYELGENIDELIERFKRGDTSRNTEGSGLGLAIAKSIIDLHDGLFEIEVDGDLFKVTITIPIDKN